MLDHQHTLLIVDDTAANIDLLKNILMPHHGVKVATNGPLALKIADRDPRPDLILLDIVMPGMASTHEIPVIFVTARKQTDDEAHGLSLGAANYLTKPISAPGNWRGLCADPPGSRATLRPATGEAISLPRSQSAPHSDLTVERFRPDVVRFV
ncbi:response regulator [Rhabdochromatium marinum]|uniref:response regulator n=1 Tax=Rhabdochromatium marinum TaxID=48729 RepID=UPI001906D15F|nr:response regulator [Rhabdochromatium marinum]MBK1648458.1 hypothetical protein [Rhabdochromatium marinum]